jgi:hypothetical protein
MKRLEVEHVLRAAAAITRITLVKLPLFAPRSMILQFQSALPAVTRMQILFARFSSTA